MDKNIENFEMKYDIKVWWCQNNMWYCNYSDSEN